MGCSSKSAGCGSLFRRGIFTLDALLGLVLIVVIAGALGAVTSARQRAAIRTAEMRAAVRRAETGLTLLQAHQPKPNDVTIKRLRVDAPSGWMWVEARDQGGARTAIVTGLVPIAGGNR
jgi:hypothetical protein